MSEPADQDDLPQVLARAFVRAWERYYQPGRYATISEEIARPTLSKRLVAMAKQGVTDEDDLAAGGFLHLILLISDEPSCEEFRMEGTADARFLPLQHVRMLTSASTPAGTMVTGITIK
jgi:hypothetical protein